MMRISVWAKIITEIGQVVCAVGKYIIQLLIAFLNPFNSLGDNFASVNILTGNASLPHSYFSISTAGIPVDIEYKRINVSWKMRGGFVISATLTNPRIFLGRTDEENSTPDQVQVNQSKSSSPAATSSLRLRLSDIFDYLSRTLPRFLIPRVHLQVCETSIVDQDHSILLGIDALTFLADLHLRKINLDVQGVKLSHIRIGNLHPILSLSQLSASGVVNADEKLVDISVRVGTVSLCNEATSMHALVNLLFSLTLSRNGGFDIQAEKITQKSRWDRLVSRIGDIDNAILDSDGDNDCLFYFLASECTEDMNSKSMQKVSLLRSFLDPLSFDLQFHLDAINISLPTTSAGSQYVEEMSLLNLSSAVKIGAVSTACPQRSCLLSLSLQSIGSSGSSYNLIGGNVFDLNYGSTFSSASGTAVMEHSLECTLQRLELSLSVESLSGIVMSAFAFSKVLPLVRGSAPGVRKVEHRVSHRAIWRTCNFRAPSIKFSVTSLVGSARDIPEQQCELNILDLSVSKTAFENMAADTRLPTELVIRNIILRTSSQPQSLDLLTVENLRVLDKGQSDHPNIPHMKCACYNSINEFYTQSGGKSVAKCDDGLSLVVDRVHCTVTSHDAIVLGALAGSFAASKELYANKLDLHYLFGPLPSIDSAAYMIFNAKESVVKISTFDLKLVSVSLITEEFQSSKKTVQAKSYTFLDTYRVFCETFSVGRIFLTCQTFVEGTLSVSMKDLNDPLDRVPPHILLSEERRLGSLFTQKKKSSTMKSIFSMKALPNEVHWSSDTCTGVGVGAVFSNVLLNDITVSIDFQHIEPLCKTIQNFNIAKEESFAFAYEKESASNSWSAPLLYEESSNNDSVPLSIPSSPSSIMNIDCSNLKFTLQHNLKPIVEIRAKKLGVSQIVFGRHLQQMAISAESIHLFELSAQYAVHTCIIGEYAMKSASNYGRAAENEYLKNRLEMHITSTSASAFSLMEIKAHNMSIFYVHRSVMTVVSLICDHIIPDVREALCLPADVQRARSNTSGNTTDTARSGMFRLGVIIHNSEVHLPANSCGSDAIVVIFKRCDINKACPIINSSNPTFCKGPLVSESMWLSEMSESQALTASIFGTTRHHDSVAWMLPYVVEQDLRTPADVITHGASVLKLDIIVCDAIICTWCSRNSVGERMTVRVDFSLQPINNPAEPTMVRNTVSVVVSSDEVNWCLTQGQYLCIVNLIQQNFCELQVIVEDMFVPPTPTTVNLTENVYGQYCMDTSLPLLSTVPIKVKRGRIVILHNMEDYYELFSKRPFKISEQHLDGQEGVWDTVPPSSCHFFHQDLLFSQKALASETSGSFQQTFKETYGEPIMSINFEELFVDFFRRHCGGGNGIEVHAENFVLIAAERTKTDMFSKIVPDINRLPTDAIVFAPRSLPSFKSKSIVSRQGNDSGEALNKANDSKHRSKDDDDVEPPRRHIRYTQQGIGNLRRCVVDIANSVAVAHMATILTVVNFFYDPIKQISEKNLAMLAHNGLGPFDFKAALDVEVHVIDCLTCLPNCSPSEGVNGLCAAVNLHYLQAWRGFPLCGPAKIIASVNADVKHIFVAPLHELYNDQIQPLVDRFTISYENQFFVLPTELTRDRNIDLLSPHVNLSFWMSKQSRKVDSPNGVQLITITLIPIERTEGMLCKDPFVYDFGNVDAADKPCLPLRFSLKDVEFITTIIEQLNISLAKVVSNTSAANKLLKTWRAEHVSQFWDIRHLPHLTYYLVHVPNTLTPEVDREIRINLADLEATLRNNTYNLNILKLNIYNVLLSYMDSAGNLNIVAGVSCSCWAYNERHESWEPVIEPITMSAIGATDATRTFQAADAATEDPATAMISASHPSTLQIRVNTAHLDVNLAQLTVIDVANKIMLPDVVTTSSIFLPPYKVVNMLGQEVSFNIGMDGWMVTSNEIGAGKVLPIEVHQLTEALESFKRKKKYSTSTKIDRKTSSPGSQQYLIEISFKNLKDRYHSKTPVPIDKEGIFPFHMHLLEEDKSSQALEATSVESQTEVSSQPIKYLQETPLTLLDMRIKEDGVREILLRSIFAIRNHTKRAFHLSLKLYGSSSEYFLLPGREWYIPVRFANPKAALFFRMDEDSEWSEALSSLQSLIVQGVWGAPTKLRAELSACSSAGSNLKTLSPTKGAMESSNAEMPTTSYSAVVVLLKPEARYPSKTSTGSDGDKYVPIRYPTNQIHKAAAMSTNAIQGDGTDNHEANTQTGASFRSRVVEKAQPLYLHILPPIQLINLLPQSIIYRIADGDDEVISEGILLSGEIIDVYNLSKLFNTRIFISIRMLNFCWSKWVQLLSKTSPFSTTEKQQDISLCSMDFHAGAGKGSFNIPAIDITMSMKENAVKFTCPLVISNCTGLQLELCEPSNHDAFISHCSQTRIETLIPAQDSDKSARTMTKPAKADYFSRTYYNLEENDAEGGSDGNVTASKIKTEQLEGVEESKGKDTSMRLSLNSSLANNMDKGKAHRRGVNLIIHSPSDHLRSFEIKAYEDWTLHDVFRELKPKLALSSDNQQASKYLFFPWREENIRLKRKIKHSISPDADNEVLPSATTPPTAAAATTEPPSEKKGRSGQYLLSKLKYRLSASLNFTPFNNTTLFK